MIFIKTIKKKSLQRNLLAFDWDFFRIYKMSIGTKKYTDLNGFYYIMDFVRI
jgi:hypothetical protein